MDPGALRCPSCGASLTPPSRFARETTCAFCSTVVRLDPSRVYSARFKSAFAHWDPDVPALLVGDSRWVLGERLARGTVADVYRATRARYPSERVVVKLLRSAADLPVLQREWSTTSALASSTAPGAPAYTRRIPEPVAFAAVEGGGWTGHHAAVYRATPGFRVPLSAVSSSPRLPQASIWVWRRVLEVLTFLHRAGYAHGAVHPDHILVQDGEHGARLVGFGNAASLGQPLLTRALTPPGLLPDARELSARDDVMASARTIAWRLGGDAKTGRVSGLPEPYAGVLRAAANGDHADAWALREQLSSVASASFGRSAFLPLAHFEASHG